MKESNVNAIDVSLSVNPARRHVFDGKKAQDCCVLLITAQNDKKITVKLSIKFIFVTFCYYWILRPDMHFFLTETAVFDISIQFHLWGN